MLCECAISSQVHIPVVFEGDDNIVSGLPICSPKGAHRTHGIYKPYYYCAAILCACTGQSPCQGLVIANFALFPLLNAKVRYGAGKTRREWGGRLIGAIGHKDYRMRLPQSCSAKPQFTAPRDETGPSIVNTCSMAVLRIRSFGHGFYRLTSSLPRTNEPKIPHSIGQENSCTTVG